MENLMRYIYEICKDQENFIPSIVTILMMYFVSFIYASLKGSDDEKESETVNSEEESICVICHSNSNIQTLTCGHYIHLVCLSGWETKEILCPYCKQEVKLDSHTEKLFNLTKEMRKEAKKGKRFLSVT